ncbi:hypothetical protein ACOMHN_037157 [Nucella lapillus]
MTSGWFPDPQDPLLGSARMSTGTVGTATSHPFTADSRHEEDRRLSVFEMLYKNIPRTPDSSRSGALWQVPALQGEEGEGEGEGEGPPHPPPPTGTATTTTSTSTTSSQSATVKSRRAKHQHPVLADTKSIYGLRRASIASWGMPVPVRPPTPVHLHLLPNNSQQQAERTYVKNCLLKDNPADTFTHQIMQNFFKAPKGRNRGYGMPRPETRESANKQLVMHLSRKPSFVRVPSHVSLCQTVRCAHHRGLTEEYCEILGPGCCSSCIETTNRHIAEEIQRRLFPEIEVTQTCLVVPALSKVMKEGHVKQVRRRRLHELRRSEPGYPPFHRSRQPSLNSKSMLVWGAGSKNLGRSPLLLPLKASRPFGHNTMSSFST